MGSNFNAGPAADPGFTPSALPHFRTSALTITDLGLIDFHSAYAIQVQLAAEIAAGRAPETLLLLEHPPVYTIGSGGDSANILDPAIQVTRTNRGGDVTFHGPGQLVGYPLVNLASRGRDLHRYLRFLESFLISVAEDSGVNAYAVPGRTGVWTDGGKLASIGVGVRRWVTMHGFALNVSNDLAPFALINPCGMPECKVTSLSRQTGGDISLQEVKRRVAESFSALLNISLPLVQLAVNHL